ncbi:MAG: aldehyde dehydrogenase family protein [Rectinema sp.]
MEDKKYIQDLVERSRIAQKQFEKFDQKAVDRIVREIAKFVFDNAELLAQMAVEETGIGNIPDKIQKNRGKARILWYGLKGKKSMGVINEDEDAGIIEIAKPVGVVGGITPLTNPIVTPMANAMAALKGKNSIIIAPHPKALKCTRYLVSEWNNRLGQLNAPDNIIQFVEDVTIERSSLLMSLVDVVVATGGPGMVKAAYSSGRPSFGVGPGNVQCIIDRDANIAEAVKKIVTGRIFDNGLICSGEQAIIAPVETLADVFGELKKNGAYIVEKHEEKQKLITTLFPDGVINRSLVGKTAQDVAKAAGLEMPKEAKLIVIPEDESTKTRFLRMEKMFPVLIVLAYRGFDEAIKIMLENLEMAGKGHTVAIHSENNDHILELAFKAPVGRILVNQIGALHNGGSFYNSLNPTTTLGCGSWGNNSISENFYYKHLLNITRIAKVKRNVVVPTDEDLWAEEE